MINFPNKIVPVGKSVFSDMIIIAKILPKTGMSISDLYDIVRSEMDIDNYIDALTVMYAINNITLENSNIIKPTHA